MRSRQEVAFVLGLYLGDGCISADRRGVFRLRIVCVDAYPELILLCHSAMAEVPPNKVSQTPKVGRTEVASYSKHWPCLFPQHGPGGKHERRIELVAWQPDLVEIDPRPLLRGLLHSDGCRVLNRVNGTADPRYHLSNVSADIRGIFGRACDRLGIERRAGPCRLLTWGWSEGSAGVGAVWTVVSPCAGLRYSLAGRDLAQAWVGRSSDDGWGRGSSSVSSGSPGRRRRQNHRGSRQEEGI